MTTVEPYSVPIIQVVFAFMIVFCLLALLGFGLKYLNSRNMRLPGMKLNAPKRLEIVENMTLDMRRRLVLVRCDRKEYLLLLGAEKDLVIDSQVKSAP